MACAVVLIGCGATTPTATTDARATPQSQTTEVPVISTPLPQQSTPVLLDYVDLYSGADIEGPILSDKANALNGQKVVMQGYMAPPLKPEADFFILTQTPMAVCPFCSAATDWPFNIVFVRMTGGRAIPALVPTRGIRVTGTLGVGTATDEATGFVSKVRVFADSVEVTE